MHGLVTHAAHALSDGAWGTIIQLHQACGFGSKSWEPSKWGVSVLGKMESINETYSKHLLLGGSREFLRHSWNMTNFRFDIREHGIHFLELPALTFLVEFLPALIHSVAIQITHIQHKPHQPATTSHSVPKPAERKEMMPRVPTRTPSYRNAKRVMAWGGLPTLAHRCWSPAVGGFFQDTDTVDLAKRGRKTKG